jgi:peptidyl-prolyl cis-trans isomerase C
LYNFQVRTRWLVAAAALFFAAPETARSAPPSSPVARPERGIGVVASFQGGQITVADLETALALKDPRTRAVLATPDGLKRFLDELVNYDLLALEAARRGYARHAEVIEAGKRAAIENMIERELAVDPASIEPDAVAKELERHREDYTRPEMRRASHINLASEQEARALIAELKGVTREAFAKQASARSEDARTRRQGGELGYFDREGRTGAKDGVTVVAPELVSVAFELKREGQLHPAPIPHGGGYSVLMLTGRMAPIEARLSKVEPMLREQLAAARTVEAQQALLDRLREEVRPEVHAELLSAVALDPAPLPDRPHGFPAAPPDPRMPPSYVEPDGF